LSGFTPVFQRKYLFYVARSQYAVSAGFVFVNSLSVFTPVFKRKYLLYVARSQYAVSAAFTQNF
jgi:hypothetical protein